MLRETISTMINSIQDKKHLLNRIKKDKEDLLDKLLYLHSDELHLSNHIRSLEEEQRTLEELEYKNINQKVQEGKAVLGNMRGQDICSQNSESLGEKNLNKEN